MIPTDARIHRKTMPERATWCHIADILGPIYGRSEDNTWILLYYKADSLGISSMMSLKRIT